MLIAGAGGHAKEILGIFDELDYNEKIYFFDDLSISPPDKIFDTFIVLKNEIEVRALFKENNNFVIGIGNPKYREQIAKKLIQYGGNLQSIISPKANIGKHSVLLQNGINILTNATITQNIFIGEGSLVHINAIIHHDCNIGKYCEISPNATILGKVNIGDYCSIGTGAVILPNIIIGNNVVVGAGSIVTKNVANDKTVKGVPAK